MTPQEAARLVLVILAACPAQAARIDDKRQVAMADAFRELLGDIPYEHCNAAVRVLLQTRSWMPSVADIRATALEFVRGPVMPGGEAWGRVQRAIREQGVYRRPGVDFVFHDPIVAKCVSALNWEELCSSENTVADRARFIELYDKLAAQSHREAASPLLAAAREVRESIASGEPTPITKLLPKVGAR